MKQDEWASRLNEHLKDYHKEPSKDLWEGIEASLNKQAKGRARYVSLSRWIAAAMVIGVIFGVTWMTTGHDERDIAQKNNKEEYKKPQPKKENKEPEHAEKNSESVG